MSVFELSSQEIPLFLLVFLRIAGFLFASPIVGSRTIPPQGKVGLGLFLALLLHPLLRRFPSPLPEDPLAFILGAVGEILVGITLGYTTRLLFAGALMAGELIGLQMGLNVASILDPSSSPIPVMSQLLDRLMVLVFLSADGHHLMIQALGRSFHWIPPLGAGNWGLGAEALLWLFGSTVILAVKLAAPVLAATFVVHVTLALVGRAAPQMNVMLIGLPLTLYLGLLVFLAALPLMGHLFETASGRLEADFLMVLRRMAHALP